MASGKSKVRSAEVYARISQDHDGKGLGVQRQLEDCRKLAKERGWTIGREYVDNDISAYSGKARPEYRQMVDDLAAGLRDGVIVYNLDRLHRRPVELEEFVDLCEQAGVREVATVTADIDLGNHDGLFMARIFAAFAAKESMRSLAQWLNDTGAQTVRGNPWITSTVRQMLRSGRIAGLREHGGQVIGPAVWPGIITPEQREQVLAAFASRSRTKKRAPRTYVLSGLLRCRRCGKTLYSQMRYDNPENRTRRYVCIKGPDFAGGCGRMTVVAQPVEQVIIDAVLARLDSKALRKALAGKARKNSSTAKLTEQITRDTAKLAELAALYAEDQITAAEWTTARNPVETRLDRAHKDLAAATSDGPLHELLGARTLGHW